MDSVWKRWEPNIGMSDIARLLIKEWLSDFPKIQNDPEEAAHVMTAAVSIFGLARHAAIGRKNPIFVEIGTQIGLSTRALLTVAHIVDGKVISIDIDPSCGEGLTKKWVDSHNLKDRWTFIGKASQEVEPVKDADFLLVDGDHGYEAVCSDMARHGVAVRNGGIIVLDDYNHAFPGKVRWVQERWRELSPLTIGAHAILTRLPGDEESYSKKYESASGWNWSI